MRNRPQWAEGLQRGLILLVRRPGQYLVTVSALAAGVLSSLEVAEPARRQLDSLPGVTESDWLSYIVVTAVLAGVLKLGSYGVGAALGREPFEVLAGLVDKSDIAPNLTDYVERRVMGDVGMQAAHSIDYRSRRITRRELDVTCQLNREVFGRTAFAAPLDVIKRRNRSLFDANPLVQRIVEAKIGDDYVPVGFSAILPLNAVGESLYCRSNGLKDSEIRGAHIAASDEWSDAVLMFAMGLLRSARGRLRDGAQTLPIVFADHLADIVTTMRAAHPDRTTVRVYAQTEHVKGGIGRMLRRLGFVDTGIVTGDGYPLWELTYEVAEEG